MTRAPITCAGLAALTLTLASAGPVQAVTPGQVDTFENGTTLSWSVGANHPVPPTVMASGGPAGTGDHYMQLQAHGSGGPASRLAVRNGAQWAGDYTAAGITALTMDIFNFGPSDLSLRLLFEAGSPTLTDQAWSTVPVLVPGGSGWRSVVFPVTASDLSAAPGSQVADALAGAVAIRLFHGTLPLFPGEAVVATVGVDNITAVPEPDTCAMMLAGLGLLGLAVRRRRQTAARSHAALCHTSPASATFSCRVND